GMGVGMGGGLRSHAPVGKVDQVVWALQEPALLEEVEEENPFLVTGLQSPGRKTRHLPRIESDDEDERIDTSPLRPISSSRLLFQASTTTGLPSPPPTKIRPDAKAERKRKREREERERMMDVGENPFLAVPGEVRERRPVRDDRSRETVSYVFRGSKKIFPNTFMSTEDAFAPADLPTSDYNYEPHPAPAPKLLWPTGPTRSQNDKTPPSKTRRRFSDEEMEIDFDSQSGPSVDDFTTPQAGEQELEEEELPVTRGLLFGLGVKRSSEGGEDKQQAKKRALRL
ncbi:hypothetical protein P7C73_g6801, partial [Tremellales sp. Uapishka_1]